MLKENFKSLRFLVLGDVMLDQYYWGEVKRISPEAPVPVFNLKNITKTLGGAANVANNLRGLGVEVELAGIIGTDQEGKIFKALAQQQGIKTSCLIEDPARPTTVKTRIIASAQQLLRIDKEETFPLSRKQSDLLLKKIKTILERIHGIVLSDYAKGVLLASKLTEKVINWAREKSIPIMVDPKSIDWSFYKGATCVTPNTKELQKVAQKEGIFHLNMEEICTYLCEKYSLEFIVVTLGPQGIYLHHPSLKKIFPAQAREVYDVSGAGDTVIASLITFFAAGFPLEEVISLANLAAGIVVGKVGTQPILLKELKKELGKKSNP